MDNIEILSTLIELKEENKNLNIELKKIKEEQQQIIEKMKVLIKKTNNMCFVYSTDSHNSDSDSDECGCGKEPQKEDPELKLYFKGL